MKGRTAIVTGGAGFIGLHLSQHLLRQGYDVIVCDNLTRGQYDEDFKKLLDLKGATFLKADLTNPSAVKKLPRADEVYHLAAINGTSYFYSIPHTVMRVNLLTLINVLDWMAKVQHGKLLFSSSGEVYVGALQFGRVPIPTPEVTIGVVEDIYNPRWSYGSSKLAGECLVHSYCLKAGVSAVIVRYHNIFGARMGHHHVIPEFALRIQRREFPFKIFGADHTRSFCHVSDAVRATHLVMQSDLSRGDIVNIGSDREEVGIGDLAARMFRYYGVSPDIDLQPAPEGSVKRRCPDVTKLRARIGFSPEVTLDEGLKLTLPWYSIT